MPETFPGTQRYYRLPMIGLYPESHGVVANHMYDEDSGLEFSLSWVDDPEDTTDDPFWWQGHVPLWISATEAGDMKIKKAEIRPKHVLIHTGMNTSLYYWSRCDVPFNGILPSKCIPYNNDDTYNLTLFEENLLKASEDLKV